MHKGKDQISQNTSATAVHKGERNYNTLRRDSMYNSSRAEPQRDVQAKLPDQAHFLELRAPKPSRRVTPPWNRVDEGGSNPPAAQI
ncbi:hypothetical protein DVH24_005706 [Malus domestica]|uniref:Uncharacterized protein n=1 Tax=Malus domestica TaxID=3750 RepID=A0A498IQE1_MALDO|nr:hypothetical protein DVH24_005706 [Malus domestica]